VSYTWSWFRWLILAAGLGSAMSLARYAATCALCLALSACSSWTAQDTTAAVKCVTRCAQGCIADFQAAKAAKAAEKPCPAAPR